MAFDAATKQKIRHYLGQIRNIVDQLDVNEHKKEKLFNKIDDLATEVDRDRTRYEIFGAFVIAASGTIGEAYNKVEPAVASIAHLFWGAKEKDEIPALPAPTKRKAIAPPPAQKPTASARRPTTLDDEIPF